MGMGTVASLGRVNDDTDGLAGGQLKLVVVAGWSVGKEFWSCSGKNIGSYFGGLCFGQAGLAVGHN